MSNPSADAGSTGGSPASARQPLFPGATPVGWFVVAVAVAGALVLLLFETAGEAALGIVQQQTTMTVLFALYTLAAAVIEEWIFRGHFYYDKGTRGQLIASIVGVSLVFALLHPYAWRWTMPQDAAAWHVWRGNLSLDLGTKAVFSTSLVFIRSLWFYWVRFWPRNTRRSLIPSIGAHLATNLGVIFVKAVEGKLVGWY